MGSKRLKAVVVKGKMKVPVADEKLVKELRTKYVSQLGGDVDWIRKYGTSFVTVRSAESRRYAGQELGRGGNKRLPQYQTARA